MTNPHQPADNAHVTIKALCAALEQDGTGGAMTKCTCGTCSYCRTRAYKTKWQRQKRGEPKRVPYTCTCGRAGPRGGCRACGMQYARTGGTGRQNKRVGERAST